MYKRKEILIETKWFRLAYRFEVRKPIKPRTTVSLPYTNKGRLLDVRA